MTDLVELIKEILNERADVYCDRGEPGTGWCGVNYCPMWAANECQVDGVLKLMRLGARAKRIVDHPLADEVLNAIKEAFPATPVGVLRNVTWTEDKDLDTE